MTEKPDIESRLRAHVVDCYDGKNDTMREAADCIAHLRAGAKRVRAMAFEEAAQMIEDRDKAISGHEWTPLSGRIHREIAAMLRAKAEGESDA